jgi:hypothetical protein
MWSTCGDNSQADLAAANRGREAGWYLVDDFLENPGIAVGEYSLTSCDAVVDLLSLREATIAPEARSMSWGPTC